MCTIVIIDGKACATVGELTQSLGGDPVMEDGYGDVQPRHCLCGVDIDATAAKYSMRATPDEWGDIYMGSVP